MTSTKVTELRKQIMDGLTYTKLCLSISSGIQDIPGTDKMKQDIISLYEFAERGSDDEMLKQAPSILLFLEPILNECKKRYPPKKAIKDVAEAIREYSDQLKDNVSEVGIEYGWLSKQINCQRLFKENIPAHSRVGVNMHAGKVVIVESMLLRDSFYLYVLAEKELNALLDLRGSIRDQNRVDTIDERNKSYVLNSNVGTFCRTSLLNFYSFIESFVNGIGLDHIHENESGLTEKEILNLQGIGKNGHLSLERKLEKFHQIIRADKSQVFAVIDEPQRKEPFKTFFAEFKAIRDSSVHHSSMKAPIVMRPFDWLDKVEACAKITLEVAKVFWDACYESRRYPGYLDLLDFGILKKLAVERVAGKAN